MYIINDKISDVFLKISNDTRDTVSLFNSAIYQNVLLSKEKKNNSKIFEFLEK